MRPERPGRKRVKAMPMKVRYTVIDGEVIAEKRNGVRKQYVPDPLGSTVAMLDNTQTQTDTFSYWPYGEVASRTGSTPTPFQYVGTEGYYKDSSDRTYVRARTLDTTRGRWMTEDPIGFEGGSTNVIAYKYNPTTEIDASGLGDLEIELILRGLGCVCKAVQVGSAITVGTVICTGASAIYGLCNYSPGHAVEPVTWIGDCIGQAWFPIDQSPTPPQQPPRRSKRPKIQDGPCDPIVEAQCADNCRRHKAKSYICTRRYGCTCQDYPVQRP